MQAINWIMTNWDTILTAIASIIATASVIVKLTPTPADDAALAKVVKVLEMLALNKKTPMLLACVLIGATLTACTPLISTVVQTGCGQDKVSVSNKGESDQTPTTTTSAAVPVQVGATPTGTTTVNPIK